MLKSLLSNKEKLIELANTPLNENCLAVILKKLPKKLGDPRKFLIPYGFSKLKCKALADLGASINLMPLSVWKELGLPELISTQMTLELANRDICTPKGIARDVFVLGRPFLCTDRALINVHGEEMILHDSNERLILNMRNDTSSYSNKPHQESINMIDIYNVSHEEIREDLFAINHPSGNPTSSLTSYPDLTSLEVNDDIFDPEEDIIENLLNLNKTKDLPPYHDNQSSGNPTLISEPETKSSSSSPTLISLEESDLIWEELEAYLASDSFPPGNSNPSSLLPPFHNSLSGSTTPSSHSLHISETNDYFLEEFVDELAHITFPPGNDDLPFFYDSVFYEDFSKVDALPSTDNEDKVFNPGILIHENLFEVTQFAHRLRCKSRAILLLFLILRDFNSPLYELPFHKEVPGLGALLSFSSENEEKVFNPGILTSKRVHNSLHLELSHWGPKAFKVIKILESPVEIFPCSYQEDIRVLDVSCLHFYPP
ncbi:reverse transcriptase domain-containing protein [Tanacetum coccineum]